MRDQILDIAKIQMKQGGFQNLSFADIAKQLSTTRANLHYHFKNKETLALETTKAYASEHLKQFQDLSHEFRGDFFGFVLAVEEMFWDESTKIRDCGICVCSQVLRESDPPDSLKSVSLEHFQEIQALMIKHMMSAVESKQLSEKLDIAAVGVQFSALMMGLMTMAQMFPTVKDAKQELNGFGKSWLASVKALNNQS